MAKVFSVGAENWHASHMASPLFSFLGLSSLLGLALLLSCLRFRLLTLPMHSFGERLSSLLHGCNNCLA